MSANKPPTGFPDVQAKLHTASKQSAFEKQKQEAEAKRKREAAETAAVYESFVKSFDNDEDDDDPLSQFTKPRGAHHGSPFGRGGGPPRRHFGSSIGSTAGPVKSGPGSLGPAPIPKSGPGSLGPTPNALNRRREHEQPPRGGYTPVRDRDSVEDRGRDSSRVKGRIVFDSAEQSSTPSKHVNRAFDVSDDEAESAAGRGQAEEKAIAKPTLRLASLPPGTSPAFIKALLPAHLEVENVKILPPANPAATTERKSIAAIVTVSKETPAADLDATVSALQNRYLGYGFYLVIHRHLSSAVSTAAAASNLASSSTTSHPFGAKPVPQIGDNNARSFHPSGRRGYAPPTSYGPGGPMSKTILHVPVQAPRNVKQVALIHKVVESVLEHGPEFEALLMSRPEVQKDEQWAWIWDARSEGGVWYRWRLWEIVTGLYSRKTASSSFIPVFEDSHAWKLPEKPLSYEYTTSLDEFVSDPEYNSSEDDESDNEGPKPGEKPEEQITWLNPLDKAKLTHLLTRLPTSLTRIRKGDIARITAFAITHSSRGADEVADLIVSNIIRPLALTVRVAEDNKNQDQNSETEDPSQAGEETAKAAEAQDKSGASLVALYVVSDILSSSATSGVRHAWRFRQLFEQALKSRKVFEVLGLMAETQKWGRLRADKWKRSISLVLDLWEGWSAFPVESQRFFVETFESPPSAKREAQSEAQAKKSNKWKTVEAGAAAVAEGTGFRPLPAPGVKGDDVGDMVGDDMVDEEEDDMYGSEMDTDIDGVPMDDDEDDAGKDGEPMDEDKPTTGAIAAEPQEETVPTGPRKRMTAADMFADSELSD